LFILSNKSILKDYIQSKMFQNFHYGNPDVIINQTTIPSIFPFRNFQFSWMEIILLILLILVFVLVVSFQNATYIFSCIDYLVKKVMPKE